MLVVFVTATFGNKIRQTLNMNTEIQRKSIIWFQFFFFAFVCSVPDSCFK